MTDIETTPAELTDNEMDNLVASTETSKEVPERAMTKEEVAPAAAPVDDTIEFTHSGKQIKATREQLIKWAQQGYDYPQKAQKLNQERTQWDQQRQQFEKKYAPYQQIDEWASKNPDKWQALQEKWKESQSAQPPGTANPTVANDPVIQSLRSELSELKTVAMTWQEQQAAEKQRQEDEKLNQEISGIKDKYKDLDWSTPDENGKSLEFKVLEHAQSNGIRKFDTAFKDFYHDELIKRAESQAKQNVSKDIQTKSKLGILGTTPTPKKGIAPVKDVKNKSYNDIEAEIRAELSQGLYG